MSYEYNIPVCEDSVSKGITVHFAEMEKALFDIRQDRQYYLGAEQESMHYKNGKRFANFLLTHADKVWLAGVASVLRQYNMHDEKKRSRDDRQSRSKRNG